MNNNNGKKLRAALLIRMSSDKQKDSPKRQRDNIKPACKNNNLEIVGEYSDLGIGGTKTSKRTGLHQMLEDARQGKFDVVACDTIDRFSRLDSVDVGSIVKPLRKAGVKLFSVHEGWCDWDDFTDRIKFFLHSELGNQWLKGHAYKVLTGKLRRMKEGNTVYGRPYGYDRVYRNSAGEEKARVRWDEKFTKPQGWSVEFQPSKDDQAVKVVQLIFRSYVHESWSVRRITRELNTKGIPSPLGSQWSVRPVNYILRNAVYIGVVSFGKEQSGAFHTLTTDGDIISGHGDLDATPRAVNQKPPVWREESHEPLIDRQTFELAQQRLEKTSKQRGRTVRTYPLSGVLRCGTCGRGMVGHSSGGQKRYQCQNRSLGRCDNSSSVRAEDTERLMVEFAIDYLEQCIDEIREIAKRRVSELKTDPKEQRQLTKQISKLTTEIERNLKRVGQVDDALVPELMRHLTDLREQRDAVQTELDSLQVPPVSEVEVRDAIREIESMIETFRDVPPEKMRTLFQQVFERVELHWDRDQPKGRRLSKGLAFFA